MSEQLVDTHLPKSIGIYVGSIGSSPEEVLENPVVIFKCDFAISVNYATTQQELAAIPSLRKSVDEFRMVVWPPRICRRHCCIARDSCGQTQSGSESSMSVCRDLVRPAKIQVQSVPATFFISPPTS